MILKERVLAVTFRKGNLFDGATWRKKSVLVVHNISYFERDLVDLLKQLMACDSIDYEIKRVQPKSHFRFPGYVILVPNDSKTDLVAHLGDPALNERIIEVRFDTIAERPVPNLLDVITHRLPGLVNWALACPSEVLKAQIPEIDTGRRDGSLETEFLEMSITSGEGNEICLTDMNTVYLLFAQSRGMSHRALGPKRLSDALLRTLKRTFGLNIKRSRGALGMCFENLWLYYSLPERLL